MTAPASFHFRPKHRLTHAREFDAVYAGKCRKNRGALMVFTLPNGLDHPRLGLAVGVRVGGAVVRARTKRLIREAFRLSQHQLAKAADGHGYDIIVSVRGTPPAALPGLAKSLVELVAEADLEWRRRTRRTEREPGAEGAAP